MDLHRAIRERELDLHFQPILDARSEKVLAFEALLRWTHPVHGAVPPPELIRAAEAIGAIEELGEWVIRRACLAAADWPDGLRVAVNLSSLQFGSRDIVGIVTDALERAGLEPDRLELEITESVLLRDGDANLGILHRLRALGLRIAMDDFGTGYSSLRCLRRFPFDKIKIARSFITEVPADRGSGAIVRAIADLAASLGMETTAEGVETHDQLVYLKRRGCTEVQGFHFSPAIPAHQIPALPARLTEAASDRRLLAAGEAGAPGDRLRLARTGS
jgi:EAL domain-containing protein (putative c-di-GMP-specific phosphodiesterase class I)